MQPEIMTRLVARAGIRAGKEDQDRIAKDGWDGWVDAQLAMPVADGDHVRKRLKASKLKIEYEAHEGFAAVKEMRPLSMLNAQLQDLWHLVDWENKMPWVERVRPADEILAATIIRAVSSEAQVREHMVDFWRDHFTVNRDAAEQVAIALPDYDQNVLRPHALGNFREMLEAVAQSTAMLAYLNNASSKASPANENYARELFELHTLGADAYLNAQFDRWREVPGADDGRPQGYIDQDVYEAARAFTGWTFADGQWLAENSHMPKTGVFTYTDAWHDPYQKRVLAVEFEPYQAPMADGRKVLDLAANHPATARHIAQKLCRRFVSDNPAEELVQRAAKKFTETMKASDQMAQVLRVILVSGEFKSAPSRLQRPLFLLASLQRSAGIELPPDPDDIWRLQSMGHRLYTWHSPAGHPDRSGYWQSPGLLVRRWRGHMDMWQTIMAAAEQREWPSYQAFADEWAATLGADESHVARVTKLLREQFGEENRAVRFHTDDRWVTAQALALLSSAPTYQAV
jgi:uncharacterized protein (DUF1800 family)